MFSEIGRVISFRFAGSLRRHLTQPRLVFDRDTGKPKGYGFCEYADAQTALSAMRNLNGHDMGGRSLRVDFAESEKGTDGSQVPGSSQWSGSNIPSVRDRSLVVWPNVTTGTRRKHATRLWICFSTKYKHQE